MSGLDVLDTIDQADDERVYDPVRSELLTGPAGSGKTTEISRRIQEDPGYGMVCATTGIAAVNLGASTLNSTLGYFDTESLRDRYVTGVLNRKLREISEEYRNLVIDEVSMLDADQLDIIHSAVRGLNKWHKDLDMGIVLTGDFCQLPPINAKWAFKAECWPEFAANTTRLNRIWRQNDPRFLEAINLARAGRGPEAVEVLQGLGVEFSSTLDDGFDGTTIIPKNDGVDRFNLVKLQRMSGQILTLRSKRWGRNRAEWKLIPEALKLRVGALVMILANDTEFWSYVNGDLGHIVEAKDGVLTIQSFRTGCLVTIGPIWRTVTQKDPPEGMEKPGRLEAVAAQREALARGEPYYSYEDRAWIVGGIYYYPVRLGYASTVHKTQGLTLDKVQVDCRNFFFAEPNMAYVAMSRVRTPAGLRIVGTPELLAKRINTCPEVLEWI